MSAITKPRVITSVSYAEFALLVAIAAAVWTVVAWLVNMLLARAS